MSECFKKKFLSEDGDSDVDDGGEVSFLPTKSAVVHGGDGRIDGEDENIGGNDASPERRGNRSGEDND